MAWTYHQSTGELERNGKKVGNGYSGKKPWRNVPQAQSRSNDGPLPQGKYLIANYFVGDAAMGKHSLPLMPDPQNNMFGRTRFLIHARSLAHVESSSDGSIVTRLDICMRILHSGDRTLMVVA